MLQEVGTPQVEEPPDSGPGQLQRSVGTWGWRTDTGCESADAAESVNIVACAVPDVGQGPENKQAKTDGNIPLAWPCVQIYLLGLGFCSLIALPTLTNGSASLCAFSLHL